MDQAAQQRLIAHDLDVVLNAGAVRYSVHQARDIANIADRLQVFVPVEFLNQRDHVDRTRGLGQIDHARIDPAMRIERKIVRTQMLRSLVIRKIIEQNGAQDGALGFYVRRKTADAEVGGRHACLGYCGPAMATSIAKLKRKSK